MSSFAQGVPVGSRDPYWAAKLIWGLLLTDHWRLGRDNEIFLKTYDRMAGIWEYVRPKMEIGAVMVDDKITAEVDAFYDEVMTMSSVTLEKIDNMLATYNLDLSTEDKDLLATVRDDMRNPSKETFKIFQQHGPALDRLLVKLRDQLGG